MPRLRLPRLLGSLTLLVTVYVGLVSACTEEGEGDRQADGYPKGSPVALADYCANWGQTVCGALDACLCLEAPATVELCVFSAKKECVREQEEPALSGRRSYDPQAAGDCLAAVRSLLSDCSLGDVDEPVACDAVLVGAVGAGGACEGDGDCVGDLECRGDRCVEMPAVGQLCADSRCVEGAYCDGTGRCATPISRGGDCSAVSVSCADDLYCDGRSKTCEPVVGEGGDCSHYSVECDDDLYCPKSTQRCSPYPGPGESCAETSCRDGAYCDAADICRSEKSGEAACTEDEECASHDCVAGRCEPDDSGRGGVCDIL